MTPYIRRAARWLATVGILLAWAGLIVAASLSLASAHDGYDRFKNPVTNISCCDNRDCRVMSANEVEARIEETKGGIRVDGKFVPDAELQEGPDGRWHICESPYSKTIFCVLQPRPSF